MRLLLEDLGVTLGPARIVEDLTLSCAPGTVVGLLGPNGCGKSRVLKTVYRALRPTSGAVRLDGLDTVSQLSPRQSAQRVAALAQETHGGFDVCVQDLVAMGHTPHQGTWARDSRTDRDLVDEALGTVGMAGHADRLFDQLSGGEKQRVLLARALAQQPRVLVLDEPTNHLDVSTQLQLLDLVRSLGVTVLAALHDLNLAAAYCDQVHLLQEGRLVAHGTPHEVFTPALIARVFGVRADRLTHPATGRLHLALSPLEGRP